METGRSVWRFANAIARRPAESAVNGLRAVDRGAPSHSGLTDEHDGYLDALRAAGVAVEVLPALDAFPDSMFVEDPALVFPDCAIRLRPGAASRFGEAEALAPVLAKRFGIVHDLPGPGHVDGGDVLVTPDCVHIGLSQRTDMAGARALAGILKQTGRAARIVAPPPGVLHLKSACSLLDDKTLLATGAVIEAGLFPGMSVLPVPPAEEAAANAIRVNEFVFVGDGYPRTRALLEAEGYRVVGLPVAEVGRLDAGLSCMSLRW